MADMPAGPMAQNDATPQEAPVGNDTNAVLESLVSAGQQNMMDPGKAEVWRHKQELLSYCQKFLMDSISWRRTSFENNWYLYRRNADSIYDPNILVRKESWQSRAFMPMTASHRENIHAALFKMLVGNRPILELRARNEMGTQDQADNIRDLILRELEKTRFETQFNMVLDDATTFGSGFMRIRYETKMEERMVRSPIYEQLRISGVEEAARNVFDGTRKIKGYAGSPQMVQTYRGIKCEWLSIWDIFPDPKAVGITGNSIAYRFFYTFGQIVEGAKKGYYFPEAVSLLRNAPSREIEPVDRAIVMADRTISPSTPRRTDYARRVQCHELFMRLPKKWVYLHGEDVDDPDQLVPARVLMAGEPEGPIQTLLAVEVNDDYAGEPPIYKLDFIPVADRFYGRGVAEMLKHIQELVNEICNQRNDNISLAMNRMFAVIEKAIVTPDDLVSKPGGVIRLDGKYVRSVQEALTPIEFPDITASSYKEVQELERYAQERTSANRVTLGTNGLANDQNRTATGLEILRQSAGEKFAYIGMLMEHNFLYDVFRAIWKNLYANLQPDDIIDALGPMRSRTFQLIAPEGIEKDYVYEPQGLFTMENKAQTQMRLSNLYAQFSQMPWFNAMACFDRECRANNIDPESLKFTPEEMQLNMYAQAVHSGQLDPAAPQGQPQQGPAPSGKSDEQTMDEAAAKLAVRKGKVTPAEAAKRLSTKYG